MSGADKSQTGHRDCDCPTMSVPEAGRRYFGIGKNASYEAARSGQIPTIRIGGRIRAIVAKLEEMVR